MIRNKLFFLFIFLILNLTIVFSSFNVPIGNVLNQYFDEFDFEEDFCSCEFNTYLSKSHIVNVGDEQEINNPDSCELDNLVLLDNFSYSGARAKYHCNKASQVSPFSCYGNIAFGNYSDNGQCSKESNIHEIDFDSLNCLCSFKIFNLKNFSGNVFNDITYLNQDMCIKNNFDNLEGYFFTDNIFYCNKASQVSPFSCYGKFAFSDYKDNGKCEYVLEESYYISEISIYDDNLQKRQQELNQNSSINKNQESDLNLLKNDFLDQKTVAIDDDINENINKYVLNKNKNCVQEDISLFRKILNFINIFSKNNSC